MDNEARFSEMNLVLPPAPEPKGVYTPLLKVGNFIYISGHLPVNNDGTLHKGKIGKDIDQEEGKLAARQVGLTILATLIANLGSLNRIKRVIKVFGMVNATTDFEKQPFIVNGCSELFVEVFGRENGIGVRSAVGVGSLPENVPVEIEGIFELNEE
ncbi:MAG TPA: RidA family protein [Prolixibacteraceae bacterium]|nr:RidA family protein [Prolixibacteraceae bacterium]